MEMEKHFKEAWKKELDSGIYLGKDAKEELLEKVLSQEVEHKTRGKWIYPMVLSSFALGVAFLLLLTIQNDSLGLTGTSDQQIKTEFKINTLLLSEKFYWVLGTLLLGVMTVLLFFGVIKKTKRWQTNMTISKLNNQISTKRRSLQLEIISSLLVGIGIVILANFVSLDGIKLITALTMTLFNCLLMLWLIRDLKKADCPHCGHQFSRKELFKMTWAPYRLRCIQCEGDIYLSSVSKNKSYLFTVIPLVSHYGLGFLGIPFPLTVFSFLIVGLFFNFYIISYTNTFSKNDEPLW